MDSTNMTSPMPDPTIPTGFQDGFFGPQVAVVQYILAATGGMFAWDLILDSGNILRLLFQHRFTFPTLVYIVSRISTMCLVMSAIWYAVIERANCNQVNVAIGVFFAIAGPSTSLLFFLRVRAMYHDLPLVVVLFGLLWLGTVAGGILIPFAVATFFQTIDSMRICILTTTQKYVSASIIISMVFDTLVFAVISYRIISTFGSRDDTNVWSNLLRGVGLPKFSKTLLQSGQKYYLVTVASNVITVAVILSPTVIPTFHILFVLPNLAVVNSMACKVFREVKFKRLDPTIAVAGGPVLSTLVYDRQQDTVADMSELSRIVPGQGNTHVTHISEVLAAPQLSRTDSDSGESQNTQDARKRIEQNVA